MRALSVKCPNCGAVLEAPGTAATIACEYCHTTSQISRRTAILERQMPMPATAARVPMAVQQHSTRWMASLVVLPVVLISTIAGFVFLQKGFGGNGGRIWHQIGPIVTLDVNADGFADPIGLAQHPFDSDYPTTLLAVSGKDGEVLWDSKSIGTFDGDTASAIIVSTGSALFLAKTAGQLQGYEIATGKTTWSAQLPEKATRFCRGNDATHVNIETAGGLWVVVDTQDGSMVRLESPGSCVQKIITGPHPSLKTPGADTESGSVSEIPDMSVERVFHRRDSALAVAFGVRKTGTKVPMVGVYRIDGYQPLWSSEVPSQDPLAADTGAPLGQISAEHVVLTYQVSGTPRITVFSIADGQRLWDAAVPGTWPVLGLAITRDRVYASAAGLYGFDLANGKLLFETAVTSNR